MTSELIPSLGMLLSTTLLLGLALPSQGHAADFPQEPTALMLHQPVTLRSGDLQMRFFPESAWTFKEIQVSGKELTQFRSHTGLVILTHAAGGWVGTGHREAGVEQVLSVTLTVDGKEVDALTGGQFSGERIELTKESTLANALTLKTIFRLDRGKLYTEHFLNVVADLEVRRLHSFMYPWKEETSAWMARRPDGRLREGVFHDRRAMELKDDAQWVAIYHPQAELAAWVRFAENSYQGEGMKHAFWNVEGRYHKQYHQALENASLKAGQRFHWQSEVQFIPASAEQWKDEVLRRESEGVASFSESDPA